ncbi:MAG: Conserved rane protein of unknown function [Modestobacter sp.]|nr:Conserved rane protein of unknown function [Modestobacter sp.]
MTGVRRLACLLLSVLAVLALGGPAAAADGATTDWRAARVLVVGVPGLVWTDLGPVRTPHLWGLAQDGAIGALSVRAAQPTTCVLDGWSTLGAGNRARYPGPARPIPPVPVDTGTTGDGTTGTAPAPVMDASLSYCGVEEQVASIGLHDPPATLAQVAGDEGTVRFGAEPGALGDAVGCATVVGRGASLAAAGPHTALDLRDTLPTTVADTTPLLTGCPLTLVSLDQLTDAGRPSPEQTDTGTAPIAREEAVAALDAQIGQLDEAAAGLPGGTLLMVAGISEVNDGRPQLHLGLADGPGMHAGWLTSASTGRAPFLQLIDLAPTALRALDVEQPASMNGQPVTVTASRPALPEALAQLQDANTRATVHYRSTGPAFWVLVAINAAVVGAGFLVLGGWGRFRRRGRRRARTLVRAACLMAAALPISTFLADVLPWQTTGSPRWSLVAAVIAMDVLVAAVAGLGPWRRRRTGPALAVLAVTLATLVGDVLTGSHLELDSLLGYDAIVAGRFVGYGNLTFGLFSVSALLLTASAAAALVRRGRPAGAPVDSAETPARGRWLLPVLLSGAVAVVLIGAPSLGRDFGGVLAAVPGFLVLGMLLARIRVTVVRLVAVLAAAVAAVTVVAVLDWLRPAAGRSHLGRFVAQVLDGQAQTVVMRKAAANLSIVVGSPLAWMLPVALIGAVWLLRPGGLLRSRTGRGPAGLPRSDARVLRAGLTAVALSLTLGALVNDSGVALPATAATVLVPLLVWLVAGDRPEDSGHDGVAQGTPVRPRVEAGPVLA